MITNRKGRAGGHQATPKTSKSTRNSSDFLARIKGVVVTLVLWGWLPLELAEQINRTGGLRDD